MEVDKKSDQPVTCGAGFDGVALCPRGFYCAIDPERNSRLCCPLIGSSVRVPGEDVIAPYFGRRTANPGEVIGRGSLPGDQILYERRIAAEKEAAQLALAGSPPPPPVVEDQDLTAAGQFSNGRRGNGNVEFAHLMMKRPPQGESETQRKAEQSDPELQPTSGEESISLGGVPEEEIEDVATGGARTKAVQDRSVCRLKPSEGRACREGEPAPRTNLHYFWSERDSRCKLYFFRGCGGNANRWEKKEDCEATCRRH